LIIGSSLATYYLNVNEIIFYPTPLNFGYFYCIGSLLGLSLIVQLITGVLIACYYIPFIGIAFTSVDNTLRDCCLGFLVGFLHSLGASFFLSLTFLHVSRAICYCSFQTPKHITNLVGNANWVLIIQVAFIGYCLPWGQMSFWGATVIINFVSVIPFIGYFIALIIWGGYNVGQACLGRFFILHVIIPFFITIFTILHLFYLHQVGSSNAIQFIKEPTPLAIYFKLKDLLSLIIISISLSELTVTQFNLGHTANYILASPTITPSLIVPEWYFLSFYAILRGIPNKLFGIISLSYLIINNNLKALLNTTYD
jgi:ubiquinol-cytochrome c reductase cytochrome b/c1 subunit